MYVLQFVAHHKLILAVRRLRSCKPVEFQLVTPFFSFTFSGAECSVRRLIGLYCLLAIGLLSYFSFVTIATSQESVEVLYLKRISILFIFTSPTVPSSADMCWPADSGCPAFCQRRTHLQRGPRGTIPSMSCRNPSRLTHSGFGRIDCR